MNVRHLCVLLYLITSQAVAQGFAGLGTQAEGFSLPDPDRQLIFPQDHGAHPDFRIEWWYLTANLQDALGQNYGVQWTLFRTALRPDEPQEPMEGWHSPQIWMGHAGLTSATHHLSAERLARGGIGQGGVTTTPFLAWIDDWKMEGQPDLSKVTLFARGMDFSYTLQAATDGNAPLILHGDRGYSVKSAAGQASHYYSQPNYKIEGTLNFPYGAVEVSGDGWLDREWSSQPLSSDQTGWDWFSLRFDSGEKLMAFVLRSRNGDEDYASGSWISSSGLVQNLSQDDFSAHPLEYEKVAGRSIPVKWAITLPERNLSVEISALNPNSWMDTSVAYWEGPVQVEGSHHGTGYLEMTGYN